MKEFFEQLVGLAGYGLVGIVIVMVIVLAYMAIKRPNNKFGLVLITAFCLIIITLFTFAGVGVVKENKEIKSDNQTLQKDKVQLADNNKKLDDSVKITNEKLNVTSLQYRFILEKDRLTKENLVEMTKSISGSFDFLSLNDKASERANYASLATDYKNISEKLNTNQFNTNEARIEIIHHNDKIPLSDKARRVGRIN
jgi:hypothetical protein